jgi:hypothetical protein
MEQLVRHCDLIEGRYWRVRKNLHPFRDQVKARELSNVSVRTVNHILATYIAFVEVVVPK